MHPKIIEAIKDRYRGDDSSAIIRAKKAGTFELILISIAQLEILQKLANRLKDEIPTKAGI
jgi:hypothetical protein